MLWQGVTVNGIDSLAEQVRMLIVSYRDEVRVMSPVPHSLIQSGTALPKESSDYGLLTATT
jgi:hypothetical protein